MSFHSRQLAPVATDLPRLSAATSAAEVIVRLRGARRRYHRKSVGAFARSNV